MAAAKLAMPKHIALSKYLTDLAVFWTFLSCVTAIAVYFTRPGASVPQTIFGLAGLSVLPALHFVTAWGCGKKSEVARHVAKLIGFLMFCAFPIGTLMSLSYLPLTDWEPEPSAVPMQPESTAKP